MEALDMDLRPAVAYKTTSYQSSMSLMSCESLLNGSGTVLATVSWTGLIEDTPGEELSIHTLMFVH